MRNLLQNTASFYNSFGSSMMGYKNAEFNYKFDFNGKETDSETGLQDYGMRIYNKAYGRFLSVDPLAPEYAFNSPYAFAENKVITFIDLDGQEAAMPRVLPLYFPRPVLTIPRIPTIPIPISPSFPLPPIVTNPALNRIPYKPVYPIKPVSFESNLDWNHPPNSPESLGEDWEESTSPENNSGSRDFTNKKTGEKIRWDPGKKDKPGWEGKDHWHRYNPNSTSKKDLYLDRFGNPVKKGSNASHIGAGQTYLQSIPGLILDAEAELNQLEKQRSELSWFNMDDWDEIMKVNDKIDLYKEHINELRDYKEAWDKYEKELKEYYENCGCYA